MNARSKSRRRKPPAKSTKATPKLTAKERAERQNKLLDEALLETFPASDPVSVFRVK